MLQHELAGVKDFPTGEPCSQMHLTSTQKLGKGRRSAVVGQKRFRYCNLSIILHSAKDTLHVVTYRTWYSSDVNSSYFSNLASIDRPIPKRDIYEDCEKIETIALLKYESRREHVLTTL